MFQSINSLGNRKFLKVTISNKQVTSIHEFIKKIRNYIKFDFIL